MAYEERRQMPQTRPHGISLADRKRLTVTGVERVDSFDEGEIIMLTREGNLIIRGSDMHMGKLDPDTGEAEVTGLISEMSYEEPRPEHGLWTRLFR